MNISILRLGVVSCPLIFPTSKQIFKNNGFLQVNTYRSYAKKRTASSSRWLERQKNDIFTRDAKHMNLKSRAAFKLLQIDEKFKIFKKNKYQNVLDLGAAPGAWNQVCLERCSKGSKILGVDILVYSPPSGVSSMQANLLSKTTHLKIKEFFEKDDNQTLSDSSFESIEVKGSGGLDIELENVNSILQNEMELSNVKKSSIIHKQQPPIDVVLSDMCAPFLQISGYANSTTNNPFKRMSNTSGLTIKDHLSSMDLCDAALIICIDLLKKNGSFIVKFFSGEEDKFLEIRLKKVFKQVIRFKPKACRDESKECYFVCLGKLNDVIDKVEVFKSA
ncbi:hypothetical protein CANARDRAFT_200878 [[Candida] arabinofermentans NRRL YB-2248]|uniref:rRNA methyltransferase 2, mitochondrial n=1 Tax=[Candida] arabinofermentans NRRL YB-2248 TaxID=983967 RepID=A0A1E4SYJ6_9ASCO|nr:hypothetical protein CANARDRAFT_200878 [[Candida] arabinofermentans NRRL YB-2248]